MPPETQADALIKPNERSLFNFIDSHLKELRWTSYGLGAVAFILLVRQTKSTSKFRNVWEIPDHFVEQHYALQGIVKQVKPDGILLVDHIPIIKLRNPFSRSDPLAEQQYLHLQLAGLSVTPEAATQLQQNTVGKHVWFDLLERQGLEVDCHITVRRRLLGHYSLNKDLVKRGACSVRHFETLPESEAYNKLLRQLIALEDSASQKGRGLWKEESRYRVWLREKKSLFTFQGIKSRLKNLWRKDDPSN